MVVMMISDCRKCQITITSLR